jgi:hypothetical protein
MPRKRSRIATTCRCWQPLAMIDRGRTHEAHRVYWAPFVAVGEGAATTQ